MVDPQDYTVAASGGDQTGQQLSASLENTNVELQSNAGFKAGNGDIYINDNVSWKANTTLTLTASNDVNVNAPITAQGDSAGLVINANTAHGMEAASGKGVFNLSNAEITLSGKSPQLTFANNDINIQNGKVNLTGESPKLKIAGEDFVVITKLGEEGSVTGKDLQGINGNLGVNYALGADIDAKATANWSVTGGFKPIGAISNYVDQYCAYSYTCSFTEGLVFNKRLEGFGHVINGLSLTKINQYAPLGLFQVLGNNSAINNLGLSNYSMNLEFNTYYNNQFYYYGNITLGSLTGINLGKVKNVNTYGEINVKLSCSSSLEGLCNSYYNSNIWAGGLAGYNMNDIIISSSSISLKIIHDSSNNNSNNRIVAGGLSGGNIGIITDSYSKGSVSVDASNNCQAGTFCYSYFAVGGLIGENFGDVINNYAVGDVNLKCTYCNNLDYGGSWAAGGLIGIQTNYQSVSLISGSYSSGNVSSNAQAGGLIGRAYDATIKNSYATGNVSSDLNAGGLVGTLRNSSIINSYFKGNVTSVGYSGLYAGLCQINCSIKNSFASPTDLNIKTLIGGYLNSASGYSAIDDNKIATLSVSTLTNSDFKKQLSFTSATSANGQVNPAWDFNKTWFMYEGQTAPILRAFMTPLTITAQSVDKTYDGNNYQATAGVSYSQTPDSRLLGSVSFSGSAIGAKNVGTYGIQASGQYSEQLGYLIHYVDGSLNINPANLTVSGISANNKTYDRSTSAVINTNQATLSGVITGDSVSLNASNGAGSFADKNVGNGKLVSVTGLSLTGADAVNYSLSQPALSANIAQASLSVLGMSASSKTYDRSTSASINTSQASLNGVITGDSVSLSASNVYGAFADSSVANAKTVSIYGLGISGADASNYNLVQPVSVANIISEVKTSNLQETYLSASQDIPQTWNSESVLYMTSGSTLQKSKRPMALPDGFGALRSATLVQLVGEGIKTAMD